MRVKNVITTLSQTERVSQKSVQVQIRMSLVMTENTVNHITTQVIMLDCEVNHETDCD